MDLLWWDGITWHTPLREIGWSYVFLLLLGGFLTHVLRQLWKMGK